MQAVLTKALRGYGRSSPQVKATLWFFVCSVLQKGMLQKGISFITMPIFTRLLSVAEYGTLAVYGSWHSVVSVIVSFSLTSGVYTMGIVKFKEEQKIFISSLQGLSLCLCSAWTLVYLAFREFWNGVFGLSTPQMLSMLATTWTGSAFGFWITEQRNAFRYKKLIAVTLTMSVIHPIVGVFCVLNFTDKVTARILGSAILNLSVYSWFFFIQMRRGKVFFSAKYWRYALLFNAPLIPHYLSNTILGSSDRIMIERMEGVSKAGIYSLAYSVSQFMRLVNDSLNKTMSPYLYQRVREKDFASIPKAVYPSLAIIALANLALIAIAPEGVAIFAPKAYYEAIYVIPPVAMSVYVTYLYLCFAPFEFYYEKRVWTMIGTVSSALLNIALNLIFIPIFGYLAAAYTTLVCYSCNSGMHYYFMRKVCKEYIGGVKPYDPKVLLLITGGFMAAGFAHVPTYGKWLVRYALTLVFLAIAFLNRKRLTGFLKDSVMKKRTGETHAVQDVAGKAQSAAGAALGTEAAQETEAKG